MLDRGVILLLDIVLAAPCDETWSAEDVRYTLDEAEIAFQKRDKTGTLSFAARAETELPCMNEPMDLPLAAKFHRVQGLAAFLQRDTDRAAQSFHAARALEPDFVLPPGMVPVGHPVRGLYEAPLPSPQSVALAAPASGRILVDGRAVLLRPTDRPAVVQLVDAQGEVVWSVLAMPGDPLPSYQERVDDGGPPPGVTRHLVVGAGAFKGAVDRQYNVWSQLENGAVSQTTSWDGWVSGTGPLLTVGGYMRFADTVDLGGEFNLIGGERTVIAGYEQEIEAGSGNEETDQLNFDPKPMPWVMLEPRMRVHIQQQEAGTVYFLLGLPVGFSPGFAVDSDLDYPRADARTTLGVSFGGGIQWQLNERTGFYAELPYQLDLLGKTPNEHFGAGVDYAPSTPSSSTFGYKPAFGLIFTL
jgi:hypothetical protein